MAGNIADLRSFFFGGGIDAEYAFLQSAHAQGLSALSLLTPPNPYKPTGALYESNQRGGNQAGIAPLVAGRLSLVGIWLPTSTTITSITFVSGVTAGATLTNQWFALYSLQLGLLRQTVNDTNVAWGAVTSKTLALTSTFTTTYTGLHYLGIMIAATTVPSLVGINMAHPLNTIVPAIATVADTGLTDTAPATATVSVGQAVMAYGYVS